MTGRRVIALGLAAALAACTLGPDYHAPEPPKGAAAPLVSLAPATASTDEPPDAWWRLYNDPVLDHLLDEAFAANTDLKAAEAHLAASRAVYEATRAGRYPTTAVEAGGVYGRDPTTDEILEYGGHKPFSDWIFDSLIDVSYEVDLFGRVRRSIEAARDSTAANRAARDALRITVAAETTRAYAQICTLGEQIAVAKRSLALVTHQRDITLQRNRAGANSDFDVVRAEGLVAQVRSTIPPLDGQRRAALFQLAALIGRTPSNAPTEAEACTTAPTLSRPIPAGDGARLLRRRPDIRQADRSLAAATAEIGVATADLYPRISLTGFWGGVDDKIDHLATENALAWGVGPSVSWDFPIQSGPRARVRQAKANADAALDQFDSVVLRALQETEQALSTYAAELTHRDDLTEVQAKAREAFGQAEDQLAAGALSNLDLLTTEQTLVAADAAVASSDAAIVQDQVAVFKALGGGWASVPTTEKRK